MFSPVLIFSSLNVLLNGTFNRLNIKFLLKLFVRYLAFFNSYSISSGSGELWGDFSCFNGSCNFCLVIHTEE